ncbi:DUF7552 domain-containing protein [Halococcus saccharolyticus]|uniref:DUF7552 domain-containing protein n=1 Tax=Halococcus saccharolyticus DSM 5350 TaxID=1227455 RepID=M0MKC5_9EURY|nr:hypothetical protein [Halococcus saccharolyticus]EMA44895.1 hypothetical protein C449_09569 [Halococcus saccharolyticus DSM 5350]
MTGSTLHTIRATLDALATDGGRYCVVCARTGEHPVPVAGLRFDDRATAARAARVARRYRARLRRYDPRVAIHDLIVCEDVAGVRGRPDHGGAEWHRQLWAVADRELARLRATAEGDR